MYALALQLGINHTTIKEKKYGMAYTKKKL